ncbi:MAG TPA: hypothetical protein V6C52_11700 [Coleofasciculaceae cyanobacterium]|jgi:hypothetical protein
MFNAARVGGMLPLPATKATGAAKVAPSVNPENQKTSVAAKPGVLNDSRRLKIAVIDNFNRSDDSLYKGFGSHGDYVTHLIRSGGKDPRLAGKIDVLTYDSAKSADDAVSTSLDKILKSLDDVYNRAKSGENIDAVNLSQAAFSEGADSEQVRAAIGRLRDLNIPVAVAAGNNGPTEENTLANAGQFEVEATRNGKRVARSGHGNIKADEEYTSFATANLSPLLASRHHAGFDINEIKLESALSGGTLNGGIEPGLKLSNSKDRLFDVPPEFTDAAPGMTRSAAQPSLSTADLLSGLSGLLELFIRIFSKTQQAKLA